MLPFLGNSSVSRPLLCLFLPDHERKYSRWAKRSVFNGSSNLRFSASCYGENRPRTPSFSTVRIFLAIPQIRTMLVILSSFIRLKERRFFIPGHEQVFNRT